MKADRYRLKSADRDTVRYPYKLDFTDLFPGLFKPIASSTSSKIVPFINDTKGNENDISLNDTTDDKGDLIDESENMATTDVVKDAQANEMSDEERES